MNEVLKQYRNRLIVKRHIKNTISIYCNYFEDFRNYFQNIIPEQINTYILQLIEMKHISISQQNQRIDASKFYHEKLLEKKSWHKQNRNASYAKSQFCNSLT